MRMVAVLALVVLVMSGCHSAGVPLREDRHLGERARQVLAEGGGPVVFRDLSGGDWDRVYAFPGPPSLEIIESDIGAQLEVSGTYTPHHDGGVLVFTKHGVVQKTVRLEPYPFDGDLASYGPNVLVTRSHPRARSLEFIERPGDLKGLEGK